MATKIEETGVDRDDAEFYRAFPRNVSDLKQLPPEVASVINAEPALQNIDLVDVVSTDVQVMKARTIRIANGASLVVTNLQLPWIAIVAQELVIDDPQSKALITRPASPRAEAKFAQVLRGSDGADMPRAADGGGYGPHRHGLPGGNGVDGEAATAGRAQPLPVLYIIAGRVRWGTGGNEPPRPAIVVMYDGIKGGDGGQGGDGGAGGNGHVGANGDSTAFNCRHGPANGGDGGFGGRGGRGGDAAAGGDGGSVVLMSPTPLLADFVLVRQEPGNPGAPGASGVSGIGGVGGQGGAPRGHCHGNGSQGANRSGTRPASYGAGAAAFKGRRGLKEYIKGNVDTLF